MTRAEHLQWAKDRALEYCDQGDTTNAWMSMVSDMHKHDELANHPAIELGTLQVFRGMLSTPGQMRHFIEGFN